MRPHQSWLRRLKGESCELQSFDEAMFFAELSRHGFRVESERVVRHASTGSFQGLAVIRPETGGSLGSPPTGRH